MDGAIKKICSKCGVEKEVSRFFRNRRNEDGLHVWCRKCVLEIYQRKRGN